VDRCATTFSFLPDRRRRQADHAEGEICRKARWAEDFSDRSVKAIGALEVLAAVGLVLPAALDIAPVLVPLAALGLVIIMVGAVFTGSGVMRPSSWWRTWSISPCRLRGVGRFGPESFTG